MTMTDVQMLLQEKPDATPEDVERVQRGEPLAYVLGHIPFLGLSVDLSSHPLIPRPETEWWTELLCTHIGERTLHVLDLCAGSGAIGLAVLKHCPNAHVTFVELVPEHMKGIETSIENNGLDDSRAELLAGDLFVPVADRVFDIIVTNPPYIPSGRTLDGSVANYEPPEALFAGEDGLELIRRIAADAPRHIKPGGEVWIETDVANIEEAATLFPKVEIRTDQYERPRLLVAYF